LKIFGERVKRFFKIIFMIPEQQAKHLVYQHINRPLPSWPAKPEMMVIRVNERPLDWIVYWTSRPHWENPNDGQTFTGHGPCLVSRADGTLFETSIVPPIEDQILAVEDRIETHLRRGV
jgi:hypothetical protein